MGVPFTSSFGTRTRIDLDVYRLGAQIWQQGQSLYADGSMPFTSDGIWLPFTYPPFAAIGFVPLGLLGLGLAGLLMSILTAALVVICGHIVLGVLSVGNTANRWWIALMVGGVAVWSNPLWMTLGFGQINIVLMTLIIVDVFVVGRGRARAAGPLQGVLTGVAAAVKLTPLVFIAVFLIARSWRPAIVAGVTFVGAGVLAWIWLPADSLTYWTHTLFHTTRIGDPAGRINQNINAMWIRLVPHAEMTEQFADRLAGCAVRHGRAQLEIGVPGHESQQLAADVTARADDDRRNAHDEGFLTRPWIMSPSLTGFTRALIAGKPVRSSICWTPTSLSVAGPVTTAGSI